MKQVTVAFTLLCTLGCSGSEPLTPPDTPPDAGTSQVPDTGQAVVDTGVVVVADSGLPVPDSGQPPVMDAGELDTGSPPPEDAGPPTPTVIVELAAEGVPTSQAEVVVHDSAGAELLTTQTDATGHAEFEAPAGATVSVLTAPRHVVSFFEVQPGDTLRLVTPAPPSTTSVGQAEILLPEHYPQAQQYWVRVGCANHWLLRMFMNIDTPSTLDMKQECLGSDQSFTPFVEAHLHDSTVLAYAFLEDVPHAGGTTAVRLSAWVPAQSVRIAFDNVPPLLASSDTTFIVAQYDDGVEYQRLMRQFKLDGVDPHAAYDLAPSFGDAWTYLYGAIVGEGSYIESRKVDAQPADQLIDLAATALPQLSDFDLDWTNARPTMSWATNGGVLQADAAVATIEWEVGGEGKWTLIAPGRTTTLQPPLFPASFTAHLPTAASAAQGQVALFQGSFWGSYEAMRTDQHLIELLGDVPEIPISHAAGVMRRARFPEPAF